MKWIHLSDIHYNPKMDGRSTDELREALPQYLRDHGITAHHLFITGDFRHAKYQENEDDREVAEQAVEFILKIADAAKVPHENIHVVPGNHDVQRSDDTRRINKIKRTYDPHHGRFQEQNSKAENSQDEDFKVDDLTFLMSRFGFYKQIIRTLSEHGMVSPWSEDLKPLHTMRCYPDFNLLYLNTSIVCNSKDDRGSLIIGNYDLYQQLKKIKEKNPDKPIFVLAHHGFDNFRSDEQKALERMFKNYPVKLYLCGDAHEIWKRGINDVGEITMGCLVQEKNVQTVFSVGELSRDNYSIEAHIWDANFERWGPYHHFNEEFEGDLLSKKKIL